MSTPVTPSEETPVYTKVEDKQGQYKLGDPKCTWCNSNKDLYRNEKYGTFSCGGCKQVG